MINFFHVGLELIDSLKAMQQTWGVKQVGTVANVGNINHEITPAIHVINSANGLVDTVEGLQTYESQQWTIAVSVAHYGDTDGIEKLMRENGELISQIIVHVQHFTSSQSVTLKRVRNANQPVYNFAKFGIFTFTFEAKFTI